MTRTAFNMSVHPDFKAGCARRRRPVGAAPDDASRARRASGRTLIFRPETLRRVARPDEAHPPAQAGRRLKTRRSPEVFRS